MTIILDGTAGIANNATDLSYTGTLTGSTGVINIGSGQVYKDASGNMGIGTASPSQKLTVSATVGDTAAFVSTDTNMDIYLKATGTTLGNTRLRATGGDMAFITGLNERARIDSSGNLLVGATSVFSSGKFNVAFDGSIATGVSLKTTTASLNSDFMVFHNSAGNAAGRITQNGTTTVAYTTSSDYRLKEAIAPMTGALDKVAMLKPVTYKWKSDGSDSQGFIAHELQAVIPDCVVGEKDAVETYTDEDGNEATRPVYQGIDTSFLVATLTAAIQEQQATITALTTRITALEAANV
jgi:hypothetical protein